MLEVLLIEDVTNLGRMGDLVTVKPGYWRNYLSPRGLAATASAKNKSRLEHERRLLVKRLELARAESEAVAERLANIVVRLAVKVGVNGKLYGSVTNRDLQEALVAHGVVVDRRDISLSDPIKAMGEYDIMVRLRGDVKAKIKVAVEAKA